MKPAGYLINTKTGLQGERGFIYDYIFAENGVFLEARSPLLEARICIAPVSIRGLAPADERITLTKGRIPGYIYDLALSVLCTDPYRECYLAVTWDGEYHIKMPAQERKEAKVEYSVMSNTLVDIHSHAAMGAFYSLKDDEDDKGFRLSLVAGKLDTMTPEMEMRLVMYGYYAPVAIEEVFDCIP
jgi:PRTRC genetic system protein A